MLFWPGASGCCCGGGPPTTCAGFCASVWPTPLYLTDSNGSHTLAAKSAGSGSGFTCYYECCYTFSRTRTTAANDTVGCITNTPGVGTIAVAFRLQCLEVDGEVRMDLTQYVNAVNCGSTSDPDWYFKRSPTCIDDMTSTDTLHGPAQDASPSLVPFLASFTFSNPAHVSTLHPWAVTGTVTVSE
jgi:hypothetical protein